MRLSEFAVHRVAATIGRKANEALRCFRLTFDVFLSSNMSAFEWLDADATRALTATDFEGAW